ncbi:MAG: hypothetical protein ACI9S8_001906 [Chlamydiales bacterium]|jgi:hypothetical protein
MSLIPNTQDSSTDMPKIYPISPLPEESSLYPPLEETIGQIEILFNEIASVKYTANRLQRNLQSSSFRCINLQYSLKSRFGTINRLQKRLLLLQREINAYKESLENHCFSSVSDTDISSASKVVNICSRLLQFLDNEPESDHSALPSLWEIHSEEIPSWIPALEKAGNILAEASTAIEISQLSDFLCLLFKSDHNEMAFSLISKFSQHNTRGTSELLHILLPSIPSSKIKYLENYFIKHQEKAVCSSIAKFHRDKNALDELGSLGINLLPFNPLESAQIALFLIGEGDFKYVIEIAEYLTKDLPDYSVRIAHQCLHNGHGEITHTMHRLSEYSPDHAIDLMILLLEHEGEPMARLISKDWITMFPALTKNLISRCKTTGQTEFAENLLLEIYENENASFLKQAKINQDFFAQDICLGTLPRLTVEHTDANQDYPAQMENIFDELCNNIPSRPRLRSGLLRMCNTIKTKPNSFSGIPDGPAARKKYYSTLETLLINILPLLTSEETPRDTKILTLSILGEGGHLCAGRFTSELHGAYSFLSGNSNANWEHLLPTQKIQSTLQILRNAIVEEICHKVCRGNAQLTHSMIAMRKLVADELALPTASQAEVDDRYQNCARLEESKQKVLNKFYKQYTPKLIIERIKEHCDLDGSARATQSLDLTDLLTKFSPLGIDKHRFLHSCYEDESLSSIKDSVIALVLKNLFILQASES